MAVSRSFTQDSSSLFSLAIICSLSRLRLRRRSSFENLSSPASKAVSVLDTSIIGPGEVGIFGDAGQTFGPFSVSNN